MMTENNRTLIDRIVFVTWTQMERVYYHKWMPSVFPLPSTLSYGAAYNVEGSSAVFLQWAKDSELRDEWLNPSTSSESSDEGDEEAEGGKKKKTHRAWTRGGRGYKWLKQKPKAKSFYDVEEDEVDNLIEKMDENESWDYGGDPEISEESKEDDQ